MGYDDCYMERQTKHVGTEMREMSHLAERMSRNFMKEVVLNWT